MFISSDFNWSIFNELDEPQAKELVETQGDEVVHHLIDRFSDFKGDKDGALKWGCRLITYLRDADHINQVSEAMAEAGAWPDSVWQRAGANQSAIVNIVKSVVTSILPKDSTKRGILIESFYKAINARNKQAALEILEHLPEIPRKLSNIFPDNALNVVIARFPDPDLIAAVCKKEKWDPEAIKALSHSALELGNHRLMKGILTAYACVTSDPELLAFVQAQKDYDFLHYACTLGNTKLIKTLFNLGYKADQETTGFTPLFYAKDSETIDLLLEAGADINRKVYPSYTPLTQAITDNRSTIGHLLDRGAKTDLYTLCWYDNQTPDKDPLLAQRLVPNREECSLQKMLVNAEIIPYVLKKYPDLESSLKQQVIPFLNQTSFTTNSDINKINREAIFTAIDTMGWGDQQLIDLLKNCDGDFLTTACKQSNVELAKQLMQLGARPNYESWRAASESGSQELMELHHSYNINTPYEEGDTALHSMIKNRNSSPEDLKRLISIGAHIEAKNVQGTPLVNACIYKNATAIEVLLSVGADIKPALQTSILTEMGEALPKFLDTALSQRPDLKEKIIAAISGIPQGSLNENLFRYAIRLGLTDVIEKSIQQGMKFLEEDVHGRTALDEMLTYGIDVVPIVLRIPIQERLAMASRMQRVDENSVQLFQLSELAIALTSPTYRKKLLALNSLDFLNGSLMTFFAKLSLHEMSSNERYDVFKKLSPTQQREYLECLPLKEQQIFKVRYLKENPSVGTQITAVQDNHKQLLDRLGLQLEGEQINTETLSKEGAPVNTQTKQQLQDDHNQESLKGSNQPQEELVLISKNEDAVKMLNNQEISLLSRLEALVFLAQHMTRETFSRARFKEIEKAVNNFSQDVGAFDAKLLAFGQELKKHPSWHPSVIKMQVGYQAMMEAQDLTVKQKIGGTSQVILAKIAQNTTQKTNVEFSAQVAALQSMDEETFKESYLALIADPDYIVYLKNWVSTDSREKYKENFNKIPGQINHLTNAADLPVLEDDRLDFDIMYKLVYALPRFDLQKKSYGPGFGEHLLALIVKLEN